MTREVGYAVEGRVATVTIQRPSVRNAMDLSVFEQLHEAGERAWQDERVRAVVVTGSDGTFSSGIDTSVFTSGGADPSAVDIHRLQRAFSVYAEMPKPTIAAVEGPAFGAGLQLAVACDFRVAAQGCSFCVMEVRWGIIPDLGGTQRLPRLIGAGRAKEMAMTARRVDAREAAAIGLAERAVADGDALRIATEWAGELAAGPPLALAGIKKLVDSAFDVPVHAGLRREADVQRRILASADFIEAVTARVQKRDPQFEAR